MNTKLITFYLPQFHRIKENDEWWGEGFTEWTNVKKSKPLYEGHNQPRVPLDNSYYDLSKKETLEKQAKLAKEYGIYGFCFYHYYFNGRKLLEKPAEILLENKEIDLNYCFSWANEPWTRSWDGKTRDVIMPQSYGGKKEWKEHFEYLLPFFKDKRYIKKENKPLFLIYRTNNIPNCEDMINYWEKLAINNGFNGIYLLETLNSFQKNPILNSSKGVVEFEPMLTMRHYLKPTIQLKRLLRKKIGLLDIVNYDDVWSQIIKRDNDYGKERYLGAFVGWDNTPRKGKKGLIIDNSTPEKFGNYLKIQKNKNNTEFVFINAWNEWAEGAYLEGDELNSKNYLKQIMRVQK
ncbi:MAG: glycoside hydrolase family 99-like domain-containing protein [Bacilli bacterium]